MAATELPIGRSSLVNTIVRPARSTDGPRPALYRANDRVLPQGASRIARADVADFMYRVVVGERTLRRVMALAY